MSEPSDLSYDPFSPEIDDDPHPYWARMREEAPLYFNEKYQFYALTRFDDVYDGLLDSATFASGHGTMIELLDAPIEMVPNWMLFKDPPAHTRLRGLVSRAFTPKRVSALEPRIHQIAGELLDEHAAGETFEFVSGFSRRLPMQVIGSLLGVPGDEQEHVAALFRDFAQMVDDDKGFDFRKLEALNDYFQHMAEDRREHPHDDLMTALVEADIPEEDGAGRHLSLAEISEFVTLLDGAGTDTVSLLLGWAALYLEQHPDQRKLLAEQPELIGGAVEELLRYEAPSPVQARLVTRDVEYYGKTVAAGSKMLLINGASTRDPREYENPDAFDVTRQASRHLSFGYGVHYCLGAALARLEGRVALEELLKRFPGWQVDLAGAERFRTSAVRGFSKLPVTV
jgi:cytochrome P450